MKFDSEEGEFRVFVGTNSEDTLSNTFILKK